MCRTYSVHSACHNHSLCCCLCRTELLTNSHATLLSAEKGTFGAGILQVRKAGMTYIKSFLKELTYGQKNPIRRLRKHLKDIEDMATWSGELQARAMAVSTTFQELESKFIRTGTDTWTVHNAQTKINELFMAVSDLNAAFKDIEAALGDIDKERVQIRKTKQSKARTSRLEVKRILQVFEEHKLPENFRMFIKDNGLAIDLATFSETGISVTQPYIFKNYKPSQDPEDGEGSMKDWNHPKWWTDADEGSYIVSCCNIASQMYVAAVGVDAALLMPNGG